MNEATQNGKCGGDATGLATAYSETNAGGGMGSSGLGSGYSLASGEASDGQSGGDVSDNTSIGEITIYT